MCFVYVVEHGAVLGINGGCMTISHHDGTIERIPKNTVEGISIFSNSVLTTQCINFCLKAGIKVGFFSASGMYRGSLCSFSGVNTVRLRRQVQLFDNEEYAIVLARRIIGAKVKNQITIMRRYSYGREDIDEFVNHMRRIATVKIPDAKSINQIIGYEGIASRCYFQWLSLVVEQDYRFEGRTRPARDPFNCMLNYGYSLLTKEICGELENRNLNPYIGFMHKDKYNHPTLASDMIEEWRPVIVDSVVLSLIQGHEINLSDFEVNENGCKMNPRAIKTYLFKLEKKMATSTRYLDYFDSSVTFREAIWHQADRLSRFVDSGDVDKYHPIVVR